MLGSLPPRRAPASLDISLISYGSKYIPRDESLGDLPSAHAPLISIVILEVVAPGL